MPTKELKWFANMPNIGHMYLRKKQCSNLSSIGQVIQTEFALRVPYSHKYDLQIWRATGHFSAQNKVLLKSVFLLDVDTAFWHFNADPPIGEWSLRSGSVFRHTDGSGTIYKPLLQAWVVQLQRSTASVRRIRTPAQADHAPSSTLDESSDPWRRPWARGSDKMNKTRRKCGTSALSALELITSSSMQLDQLQNEWVYGSMNTSDTAWRA